MRMVIGVDWSEETFAALEQAIMLYLPQEVSLVHGVDLGIFQYPMVAEAGNVQGYDEFRHAMQEAGRQLMERTSALVPTEVLSITTVCEFAKPASLVLDTATKQAADMIVVGAGGRGRMAELLLGSISHRIAMHAPCSTLIVKRSSADIRSALVAVEDRDDAGRIRDWLRRYPFRHPVDLTLVRMVEPLPATNTFDMLPITAWLDTATQYANDLVRETAASLQIPIPASPPKYSPAIRSRRFRRKRNTMVCWSSVLTDGKELNASSWEASPIPSFTGRHARSWLSGEAGQYSICAARPMKRLR